MHNRLAFRSPVYRRGGLGQTQQNVVVDNRIHFSIKNVLCNATNAVNALARNSYRKYLYLKNPDLSAVLYIGFGSPSPSLDYNNLRLLPNEEKVFDSQIPIDQIFVISTIDKSVFLVGEG